MHLHELIIILLLFQIERYRPRTRFRREIQSAFSVGGQTRGGPRVGGVDAVALDVVAG